MKNAQLHIAAEPGAVDSTASTNAITSKRSTATEVQRNADILKLRDSLQRLRIDAFGGVVSKCAADHHEVSSAIFIAYMVGVSDALDGVAAPAHVRDWINELLVGFSHHHQELCKTGIAREAAEWH
jgi:hypothetical protein